DLGDRSEDTAAGNDPIPATNAGKKGLVLLLLLLLRPDQQKVKNDEDGDDGQETGHRPKPTVRGSRCLRICGRNEHQHLRDPSSAGRNIAAKRGIATLGSRARSWNPLPN